MGEKEEKRMLITFNVKKFFTADITKSILWRCWSTQKKFGTTFNIALYSINDDKYIRTTVGYTLLRVAVNLQIQCKL